MSSTQNAILQRELEAQRKKDQRREDARHKEIAEANRRQLEAIEDSNRIDEERAENEQKRLKIEKMRLRAEKERQRGEEAERELLKQQAEQLRQLRNSMADSFDTLNRLEKLRPANGPASSSVDDALLRSVAALLANLSLLHVQSDTFTDLADMKELRQMKSRLADYIAGHAAKGDLPPDPFSVIEKRLGVLARFFAEADKASSQLLEWNRIWLKSIPKVGLVELQAAQAGLEASAASLPQIQERLRQMLSPLDWNAAISDLHPELLLCAECCGQEIPEDPEERGRLHCFAHATGELAQRVEAHFTSMAGRIRELVTLREDHLDKVRIAESHIAAHDFRSAAAVLDSMEHRFTDVPYQSAVQANAKLLAKYDEFAALERSLERKFKDSGRNDLAKNLARLVAGIDQPHSELGRECHALVASMESQFAALLAARRSRRVKVTAILAVLAVGGWLLVADAEKARIEAVAQAERENTARIAPIPPRLESAIAAKEENVALQKQLDAIDKSGRDKIVEPPGQSGIIEKFINKSQGKEIAEPPVVVPETRSMPEKPESSALSSNPNAWNTSTTPHQHTETRASDAEALASKTGKATNAPMPGERYPETRLRHLDQAYVENKSTDMLRYAINEMFARHGAVFPQKEISVVFETKKWYRPRPGLSFDQIEKHEFSEIERFNLKVLGDARDLKRAGTREPDTGPKAPKIVTPNGAVANAPMEGERFSETRLRLIDPASYERLSTGELRYAINEMYARHGAVFPQREISAVFHTKKWYRPRPDLSFDQIEEREFSEIERFNLKVLGEARDSKSTRKSSVSAGAGIESSPQNGPGMLPDMRKPIDAIYAAWERLDINSYIAQWAEDGVKIDPKTNGKTRIQVLKVERARLFEKLASVETQHETIFRNIENGIATFDVTYKMRFTFKSGKTFSENAKESYRLQKYSNRWLIVENKDYGS